MYCGDCLVPLEAMDIYCWCCGKPTYENTLNAEQACKHQMVIDARREAADLALEQSINPARRDM